MNTKTILQIISHKSKLTLSLRDCDVRKSVQRKLREGQSICANRVIHNLGGIEVQQRGPSDGVESLKEEHDSHIAVYEAAGSPVRILSVLLGKTANDE